MGIAESFLKNEECINVNGYKWVGKNRSCKGGGGIGFLVSDQVNIVDDNLCNSQSDEYERLWLKIDIDKVTALHVAVAYFPVQGTNTELVNDLYNQLLADIIQIENSNCGVDPHILLMGDFNGRIGDVIYGGDPVRNSNGELLLEFVDNAHLEILNCNRKCKGKITWFRHPYSSTIDYFLSSNITEKYIVDMLVDEERHLNIGSDHNMLITNIKFNANENNWSNEHHESIDCNSSYCWNICKDFDWRLYQNVINEAFVNWNPADFQDVNSLWDNWKDKLITISSDIIGFKDNEKKLKHWWCKSIDEAIKERKEACKEHRKWSKYERDNKEKGDQLWEDYKLKKQSVKTLIHQKITQMRFDRSVKIANAGGPSSRDFWKELRGTPKKESLLSLKLPDSDKVVSDKNVMKHSIMHYWHTLGKMDKALSSNNEHDNEVDKLVNNIRRNNFITNLNVQDLIMDDIVILFNDVKEAISDSKNNKSPGLDLITNELLKNGGDGLVNSLTKLFNRLMVLEDNDILSEIQGGFRKDHRCEDHVLSLKGIAATRLAENKNTYMAFLDFRKAFDTVWRNGLLSVAWNLGIRGRLGIS
ncbi:uncharacterized protein [Amphiura filiformis]|uniref:uncharacterized protein n=1 Tax=Amphiura filiformis TaxID=82378 RepID=UPI003B221277